MVGLGAAVSVSDGSVWAVLARAGKAGNYDPLVRIMGENAGLSW